jgi:hypothetical protein
MATQGWQGIRPELLEAPAKPRGRRTVAELIQAEADKRSERQLLAEVTAELDRMVEARAIAAWYHRPDRPPREKDREHKGMPDLVICTWRKPLLVELKRPDGKGVLSPEQQLWLGALGPEYAAVALSVAELLAFLWEKGGVSWRRSR